MIRRLLCSVAAVTLGAAHPAAAQFSLGNMLPGNGFSVDVRRGTYLSQVKPAEIDNRVIQEEAQGLGSEGDSIGSYEGLRLRMPEVEAKLAQMLATVDGGWPHDRARQPQPIVVASGEYAPQTFADGTIAVRMGLLIQAETDDEAAFILAHELGHIRLGHFADDGNFRRKRQIATLIGRAYAVAIAADEAELVRRGNHYQVGIDDDRRVREQREAAAEANATLRRLMLVLMERPWARNEEDQADALAFDLIGATGYSPSIAAPAVFDNLDADYELRARSAQAIRDVLRHVGRTTMTEANVNAAMSGQSQSVIDEVRRSATRVARDRLLEVGMGYLGQRHRTPEARNQGITTYSGRAYPTGAPSPEPQTDWLDDIRSMPEFQQARTVVQALQASKAMDEASDLPGAIQALAPALETNLYASSPVVANAAARLHGRNNDIREADRLYSVAHTSADQSLSAFVDHAKLMADSNQFERAVAVVELGKAHVLATEPDVDAEKPFLPTLVMVAFRRRQQEEGLTYLRRCMAYEDDALRSECTRAVYRNQPDADEMDFETQARVNATLRSAEAQSTMGGDVEGLLRGVNGWLRGGN